jgi:branched-chain amino acid transport system ATP-binding protein
VSDAQCLEVRDLHAGYGQMEVVGGVDFVLRPREVVAMVGRNGAGKSTTMAAVAGWRTGWFRGQINVDGHPVNQQAAAKVAKAGLAMVPEGRRIFRELTVNENLHIGAYLRRRKAKADMVEDMERARVLFPALRTYAKKVSGSLSGGEQQMIAIAQALMARPRYLLLDEPTSGLAPGLCEQLYAAISALAESGIGVLVVEQSVDRALRHTHRTYVMESGRIALDGPSETLAEGDEVTKIVMGVAGRAPV